MAAAATEVRALLVPISDGSLLLPSAVVAEIASLPEPSAQADTPAWLIGQVAWRRREIPLVALECADDPDRIPIASDSARMVVLHGINETARIEHYAVVAQGIPQAVRATTQLREEHDAVKPAFARAMVRVDRTRAAIPDLDGIELQLAKLRDADMRPAPA